MVRSSPLTTIIALLSIARLTSAVDAQTETRHRPRPAPNPTPVPTPAPRPPGGNDAGGDSNVRPGSLAPRSSMGIGRSSRSSIDLLSYPAANQTYPTPPIIVTPIPPRRDDDCDRRARWWYNRHHDRGPVYYDPREAVVTVGTGLTVRSLSTPTPAVSYDAATGAYVYGYANPGGPPLLIGGPYAAPPAAMPIPNAAAPVPAKPPTPLELAREHLRQDEPAQAVTVLREHLKKTPDDARAQRVMAIALLEQKRFDDAVASMRQAYRTDPNLANEAINHLELGYDDESLRSLLLRTVTYANRVDSGSAWLTVAALMQAEGRHDLARNMLEKARKQGLETEVLGAMNAALRS